AALARSVGHLDGVQADLGGSQEDARRPRRHARAMSDDGKKDGEVISLDEARKKAEGAKPDEAPAQPNPFEPVVTAIAVELAKLADKDGVVRVGGEDDAAR